MCYKNHVFWMSFLAQQFTTLSHIPVCHVVKPNWDLEWLVVIGRASGARPHTPIHTYRIHTHWPQQRSLKRSDPTAVWVSDCLSVTAADWTIGSFCVVLYTDTEGQLECVCVRWLQHSSAASIPFTRKSRVTNTPEQRNHTNTQKAQSCYTQGAWETL